MPKTKRPKHDLSKASRKSARGIRITSTHIFFWGSVLSNWHIGNSFKGSQALKYLVPELDKLQIRHESSTSFSTRLISDHEFNCGEQFMMAIKAWLFDGDVAEDIQDPKLTDSHLQPELNQVSILQKILRQSNPKVHKSLGRTIPNFDDDIWSKASIAVVVASQIARAEADPELKEMYLTSGTRAFVEGSPSDKIWGVGLKWNDPKIDEEKNWRGTNRLGKCHDLARLELVRRDKDIAGERGEQM